MPVKIKKILNFKFPAFSIFELFKIAILYTYVVREEGKYFSI